MYDSTSKISRGQTRAALKRPRATTDGRWFWCNQDSADYAVEVGGYIGLVLYIGLCRWHARSGGRDEFHASAANLSAATGLGVRTVEGKLDLLEKAGLILKRTGRFSGIGGAHAANTYLLPAPPSASHAEASAPDSGIRCGQIEGSLRSKEEPSAATASPPPTAGAARGKEEIETQTQPERPWY